jgi:hypothetical protein
MRHLITALMLILAVQSCGQQTNTAFFDKVSTDFSRHSAFIAIQVRLPNGVISALIENDELYHFFTETKGYDKSKYLEEIRNTLISKKPIPVSDTDFGKYDFVKVDPVQDLQKEFKQGKVFILNKYFRDNVIVEGLSAEKKNALVNQLFNWNIATRIDDESGYLVIYN